MGKVIVIDDNVVYCDYVGNLLAKEGIATEKIYSFTAGKKTVLSLSDDDIILSDLRFPGGDGIELLRIMREAGLRNPFFIMTDYDEVPTAVRSMKSGADDYISKRKLEDELLPVIRNLLQRKSCSDTKGGNIFQRESEAFQFIDRRIRLVSSTNISVLILGENGTGKEHIAEKLHRLSDRANKPFIAVDCGLLSSSLAASALFGHEKGAFTGATESKRGYFGEADRGTLFLDEVGNLPMEVQQMLLRAIQVKTYRAVGAVKDRNADVRIIAATNEDLEKAVEKGTFRRDLYYRLREFIINIPPLRKCREDILPLAKFFIDEMNSELHKSVSGLDEEATERLHLYNWPGNVRELRQTIQTAVLMTGNGMITAGTLGLPEEVVYANSDFSLVNDEMQKERIIKALKQADGNKRQAARLLGISPPTLYKKLEQYNIQ